MPQYARKCGVVIKSGASLPLKPMGQTPLNSFFPFSLFSPFLAFPSVRFPLAVSIPTNPARGTGGVLLAPPARGLWWSPGRKRILTHLRVSTLKTHLVETSFSRFCATQMTVFLLLIIGICCSMNFHVFASHQHFLWREMRHSFRCKRPLQIKLSRG